MAPLLVLAAHPDDEVIGVLGSLYPCPGTVAVAFLTDGAPARRWRPSDCRDRAAYRRLRRREAAAVWTTFAPNAQLHFASVPDQQLSFHLHEAAAWLTSVIAALRPGLLLAPAYEGGHPDHDAANVLAAYCARRAAIPAWEYALYTAQAGTIMRQCFPGQPGWTRRLNLPAAAAKRHAMSLYASQAATLAAFSPACEAWRPLPRHDYRRPALAGPAVYELWGWPWRARLLARHYAEFTACASCC